MGGRNRVMGVTCAVAVVVGATFASASTTLAQSATPVGDATNPVIVDDAAPPLLEDAVPLDEAAGRVVEPLAPAGAPGSEPLQWTYEAPSDGEVTFDTHGSEMDTVLTVSEVDAAGDTALVAAADDEGDVQTSAVTIDAAAGQEYLVQVEAKDDEDGLVSLAWSEPAASTLAAAAVSYASIPVSTDTGEKPQSKVWEHAGAWWTVLASDAVSPAGAWLWRLGSDGRWTNTTHLSSATNVRGDAKQVGDVTHIFLHGPSSSLVSVQYDAASGTYVPWAARPTATPLSLPGSETATIDIDSTGRMWLVSDSGTNVNAYYSDYPYTSFSGPVVVATGTDEDDIGTVVALPGRIGVFWSNQNTKRFGFRTHADGTAPTQWTADEVPAGSSAVNATGGMADDHMHMRVASDGTVFVAAKTSYNSSSFPVIVLLVRRPNGSWDPLYEVDRDGTRPVVALNEADKTARIFYTESNGLNDILSKTTPMGTIAFGSSQVVIEGDFNNVTTAKSTWSDDLVVLAASTKFAQHVRITNGTPGPGPDPEPAPPVAISAGVTTTEGVAVSGLLGATGGGSGPRSFEVVSEPASGSVVITDAATGAFTYTPAAVGIDSFTFRVGEGGRWSAPATLTIDVRPGGTVEPPVAVGSAVATAEGVPVSGTLASRGGSGGPRTFEIVDGPASGSVAITDAALGAFTYTPGTVGTQSFTFRVGQNGVWSAPATVTVTVTALTSPLRGSWGLDEGSGSTVFDGSGLGNHGTITGAPTWGTRGSSPALQLNGSDYVSVPDSSSLDITGPLTLAAWVRPERAATQYLVKKAAPWSSGFELGLSSSRRMFVRFNERTSGNTYRVDSISTYPTNGDWVHVAATYDGATTRLFVNGVEEGSGVGPASIRENELALTLGAEPGGDGTFRGGLDAVRVYAQALTPQQVAELAGVGQVAAPVALAASMSTPDGVPVSGVLGATGSGGALSFEVVDAPAAGSAVVTDATTGAFTYTPAAVGTDTFTFRVSENGVWSAPATVTVTVTAAPVAPVAVDGSISTTQGAPVDGVLAAAGPGGALTFEIVRTPGSGSVAITDAASGAFTYTPGSVGTHTFTFRVGQNGVWSTPATVTVTVTALTSTLRGSWALDEGSGSTVLDGSGQDNHGALVGAPTWGTRGSSPALQLNGSSDYVSVPDSSSLDVTGPLTVSAWIRPERSGTQYVVKKAASWSNGFELGLSSSRRMFVRFNQRTSANTYRVESTSLHPTNGDWVHVAATYDGTTTRLFVNGVEEASGVGPASIRENELPLTLGAEPGGDGTFRGGLDDVRVYSQALTPAQVAELAAVEQVPAPTTTVPVTTTPVTTVPVTTVPVTTTPETTTPVTTVPETTAPVTTTPVTTVPVTTAPETTVPVTTVPVTTVPVTTVPVAPVALDGSATTTEDGPVTGVLGGTGSGGALTFELVDQPASGSVAITDAATGAFTYTPGAVGTHGFTFRVGENGLWSAPARVTVTVTPGTPALRGWWSLDEGSGPTAFDGSGFGNNGIVLGAPTWGTRGASPTLQLNGATDYVSVPDTASLDASQQLTVAAWIRPEQAATQYLVKKSASWANGFELGLSNSRKVFLRLNQRSSANTFRVDSASSYPVNADWIHVAATYDGTTMRMFVNGVEEASVPGPASIGVNALEMTLGAEPGGTGKYRGGLDDVRIFAKALNAQQISELMAGAPVAG